MMRIIVNLLKHCVHRAATEPEERT
jgi:hypothetical protein